MCRANFLKLVFILFLSNKKEAKLVDEKNLMRLVDSILITFQNGINGGMSSSTVHSSPPQSVCVIDLWNNANDSLASHSIIVVIIVDD